MRTVELFSGAGGLSLGFGRAGCDVVRAFDVWPEAVAVYRANLGHAAEVADIGDLLAVAPAVAALHPDLICGGSPCQDFSAAGRRVEGERASLMVAFAMVVIVAWPRWFLLENVPQAQKLAAWATARNLLVRAGYGLTETVVDASRYGVGQSRRRLIVVGRIGEADGFLESAIRTSASERLTTIRDILGGEIGKIVHAHARHAGKRRFWSSDAPGPTIRESSRRPMPENADLSTADRTLLSLGALYVRPFGGGGGGARRPQRGRAMPRDRADIGGAAWAALPVGATSRRHSVGRDGPLPHARTGEPSARFSGLVGLDRRRAA